MINKKEFKDIIKLNNFSLLKEKNDFLEKLKTFLYMTYGFKDIQILSDAEPVDRFFFVEKESKEIYPLKKKFLVSLDIEFVGIKTFVGTILIKDKKKGLFKDFFTIKFFLKILDIVFERQSEFFKLVESNKDDMILESSKVEQEKNQEKFETKKGFISYNIKEMPSNINLIKTVENLESAAIKEMLRRSEGKKNLAANKLGITERMIGYKIKKLGL